MPEDRPLLSDHRDDPGSALVRVSAVVPGTPEEVWWSVATGAGLSGWFVPAKLQERVGGAVVTDHGPFGHSHGVVVAYDPPTGVPSDERGAADVEASGTAPEVSTAGEAAGPGSRSNHPLARFAYEEREWGTDVPPWRTEILVEPVGYGADRGPDNGPDLVPGTVAATGTGPDLDSDTGTDTDPDSGVGTGPSPGPTCRVRITSGLTEEGGPYGAAVAATEEGWVAGLRNLRLVREHFPGETAGGVFVVRGVRADREAAWAALLQALGLAQAAVGDEVVGAAGAPSLAGVVEEITATSLLLRTTSPAPGLVELSAHTWSTTSLMVHAHLFGPAGPMIAEAERPRWDAWLHARFPGARPA